MRALDRYIDKKIHQGLNPSEEQKLQAFLAADPAAQEEYNFHMELNQNLKSHLTSIEIPTDLEAKLKQSTQRILSKPIPDQPLVPTWAYLPVVFFIILGISLWYVSGNIEALDTSTLMSNFDQAQPGYIKYGGLILLAITILGFIDFVATNRKKKSLPNFLLV